MDKEEPSEDLNRLCVVLNTDDRTQSEAKNFLEKFVQSNAFETNGQHDMSHWVACSVYVASHQLKTRGCTSLSAILGAIKLSLYDFFEPLQIFITAVGVDEGLLSALKTKYVILNLLFASYSQFYEKHFKRHEGSPGHISEKIFRFGWSLFLVSKSSLGEKVDFIPFFHLQMCCFNLLLVHMPPELKLVAVQKLLSGLEPETPPGPITPWHKELKDTLYFVCHANRANFLEVYKIATSVFYPLLQELVSTPNQSPTLKVDAPQSTFGGLLDTYITFNEKALNHYFDILNSDQCDFNERLFLEPDSQLLSPMRQRSSTTPHIKSQRHLQKNKLPTTWLSEIIQNSEDGPSLDLIKYLNREEHDLTNDVEEYLKHWIVKLGLEEKREMVATASKFYYRLLLLVLRSEEKRLGREFLKRIQTLLQEPFLRPLFSISVDVVILIHYYVSPYDFPWVMRTLNVHAFDYPRVIECLVKLEPSLPPRIVKELNGIEQKILQQFGWASGSPVFTGNSDQQKEVMAKRLEVAGTPSHLKEHAHVAIASNTDVAPNIGVDFFFRKAIHYGCLRLTTLRRILLDSYPNIGIDILLQAEYAFAFLLTQHTEFFKDRHLDQILLCVFFGFCRIANPETIRFQELLKHYLLLPNTSKKTFLEIEAGTDTIDIIAFYNRIFLNEFNQFMLSFEGSTISETIASPSTTHPAWHPTTPKIKNFFLTPMKGTPPKSGQGSEKIMLSPTESPSKKFRKINSSMVSKVKKELFPANPGAEAQTPNFSNPTTPYTLSTLSTNPSFRRPFTQPPSPSPLQPSGGLLNVPPTSPVDPNAKQPSKFPIYQSYGSQFNHPLSSNYTATNPTASYGQPPTGYTAAAAPGSSYGSATGSQYHLPISPHMPAYNYQQGYGGYGYPYQFPFLSHQSIRPHSQDIPRDSAVAQSNPPAPVTESVPPKVEKDVEEQVDEMMLEELPTREENFDQLDSNQ